MEFGIEHLFWTSKLSAGVAQYMQCAINPVDYQNFVHLDLLSTDDSL